MIKKEIEFYDKEELKTIEKMLRNWREERNYRKLMDCDICNAPDENGKISMWRQPCKGNHPIT